MKKQGENKNRNKFDSHRFIYVIADDRAFIHFLYFNQQYIDASGA